METDLEREDAYRDIGYLRKDEIKRDGLGLQQAINRVNERQVDHRQRNFELVKELDPELVDSGQGSVTMKIHGRQIDFHLPSNTFYLHAKQTFGYGIEEQVRKIQQFLKGK